MRRLWTEDNVTHQGKRFQIEDVTIRPKPIQDPLEVWLGGISPLELRRVGRHSDGWLPSFCTPRQVSEARVEIERVASENDRHIDPEHYGALIAYRRDGAELPQTMRAIAQARNPEANPEDLMPTRERLPAAIQGFVDVGFSKFVIIPAVEPDDWSTELSEVADLVKPMET